MLMVGIAVLTMTSGACSGQEPGVPAAGSASTTAIQPSTSAPSVARPAVLPLDEIQPCLLVTDGMRQQFAIDRPDAASTSEPNAPVCTFISSTVGRYVVAVVRDKGVDALGRSADASVGGYRAVEIRRPEFSGVCHLSIDVADGQRLDVEIQRRDSTVAQDQICRDTMAFAEAVLAELRQRLGR